MCLAIVYRLENRFHWIVHRIMAGGRAAHLQNSVLVRFGRSIYYRWSLCFRYTSATTERPYSKFKPNNYANQQRFRRGMEQWNRDGNWEKENDFVALDCFFLFFTFLIISPCDFHSRARQSTHKHTPNVKNGKRNEKLSIDDGTDADI